MVIDLRDVAEVSSVDSGEDVIIDVERSQVII
jgi:hypothetical protein